MSRSRKHHPIIKGTDRFFKRESNRAARRVFDVGKSESIRRRYTWSICDWRSVYYSHNRGRIGLEEVWRWLMK